MSIDYLTFFFFSKCFFTESLIRGFCNPSSREAPPLFLLGAQPSSSVTLIQLISESRHILKVCKTIHLKCLCMPLTMWCSVSGTNSQPSCFRIISFSDNSLSVKSPNGGKASPCIFNLCSHKSFHTLIRYLEQLY